MLYLKTVTQNYQKTIVYIWILRIYKHVKCNLNIGQWKDMEYIFFFELKYQMFCVSMANY